MCNLCDMFGGPNPTTSSATPPTATSATSTVSYTMPVESAGQLVDTVDTARDMGLSSVFVSTREDGPSETFMSMTGPADELAEILLAILVTGFPAQLAVV
jgi:hypothetical protein